MTIRPIEKIVNPPSAHWVGDGFHVHGFMPGMIKQSRMNPFILFDYMADYDYPPSDTAKGVGSHPHRGLETVTLLYKGELSHHDSQGNSGTIRAGDVQWMTAGSGILHKEYHSPAFTQSGGAMHGVQLWVNLPAKDRMTTPHYQALSHDQMGRHTLDDNKGEVHVIAGHYKNTIGPARTHTPIHLYDIRLQAQATLTIDLPQHYNTCILMTEGQAEVSQQMLAENQLALFENKAGSITLKSQSESKLLLLSGEPIDEPIVHYGPFVMNTEEEIRQAIRDFNQGKFGQLD